MVEVSLSEDDCEDGVWSATWLVHVGRRHSPDWHITSHHCSRH